MLECCTAMRNWRWPIRVLPALALALAGCSSPASTTPTPAPPPSQTVQAAPGAANASPVTLTLYNAQHEDLVTAMVSGFTQSTGIKVNIRSGKDFELANQLVQEGDASPADVFVTENSPAMQIVQN